MGGFYHLWLLWYLLLMAAAFIVIAGQWLIADWPVSAHLKYLMI